jgi:eukaryotic-like serine/threonine-protein kinase
MDGERWSHVQELFHAAVNLPEPERLGFLQSSCGDDTHLVDEVVSMLTSDSRGESLLDRGMTSVAFQVLGNSMDSIPSQEFGPYRLKRILGEGGMGVVWLAERSDAGNIVAIKFLPHAGLSPARRERFAREIRTLAKLKHPFIARLYDAGALSDGAPWFVMEYVEGSRITEYCREPGRTIDEKLRLFRMVCEAVQYAHGQEIIHRDLKPSNIMVAEDGTPRILDFGIARELHQADDSRNQTRAGLRFMSPDYAAPEWIQEGIVGLYTDVYSLGVILYEILTGQLPFEKSKRLADDIEKGPVETRLEKPSAVAKRIAALENSPNSTTKLSKAEWSDLDQLCLKAMRQDASDRYHSVEALTRDIVHYLNKEPLDARPDSFVYRTRMFVRRNRVSVLTTSVAFILFASVVGFFGLSLTRTRNAELAEALRAERIQGFMLNLFQGGDKDAGPAEDLRVVTLIDRGVQEGQSLGKEPQVQADLYQTLGTMYQRLGKFDRAEALLRSSLQERESFSKPEPSAIADNLIVLGLVRSDEGQSKDAEQLVRGALASIHAHAAQNQMLLARAESALGSILIGEGQYASSIAVLDDALSIQSAKEIPSPEMAQTLRFLADARLYLGQYDTADSLYQRALAIDRRLYGSNHPSVSEDLRDLAENQEVWGHYPQAEQYERQSLQIAEAWYGKDHPDTAAKMTTLAGTLIYENRYPEAEKLLQQALLIQQRAYGNMHQRVAYVLNLLGSVANHERNFKAAEADDQRVIDIYRSVYGDGAYQVAIGMANLGTVYLKEEDYARAERNFREAVLRETKALSDDNIVTSQTKIELGRALLLEHRYRDAEKQTRAGYESLLKQTSSSTSYISGARHDLAAIYEALNQPDEAQKFRDELAANPVPTQTGTGQK